MKIPRMRTVVALGALVVIVAGGVAWLFSSPELPEFSEVRARWRPSDGQLLDRNGEPIHEIRIDPHGRRLAWTPLGEISPALEEEVIASEDHRFARHFGVDLMAVSGALAKGVLRGHLRGASTITMQLVAMFDPGLRRSAHHRGILQKVEQMRAALALERRWSKDQILESYLNMVTWRGELQGIGVASRVMFDKAPHGINRAEAIVLASLLRAPNANRDEVKHRALLLRQDSADAPALEEVAAAIDSAFAHSPSHFARLALAPNLAQRLLPEGSAQARCTLDRDAQMVATSALSRQVEQVRDRNVDDGAVLVVDNATGEVWAYVGGAGEFSSAPYFDAVHALRQPGSALKPFLYALAIERRLLTPASILDDSPLELPEQRGLYRPLDYDRRFRGLVSMRTALASSLNVPAVRTADMVGVDGFAEHLRALGFDGIMEEGDYYGSAIALGSADVTLWQIVNAYRTLANRGEWSPLRIQSDSPEGVRRRVYSDETAYLISDILSDRASRSSTFGLENSLATPFWSAVKTGTSKDMRDNWCVGYTRRFTVGVWVGNSSGAPMRDITGMTGAAPVWLEVVSYLHQRFGEPTEKPRPRGLVASRVDFRDAIEPAREELFLAGTEPNAAVIRLDSNRARITSPADGSIVAFDPDIPVARQKISFEGSECTAAMRWKLDGSDLGAANVSLLWTPKAGSHRLTLVDRLNRAIDAITFEVRGSLEVGNEAKGATLPVAAHP
jgi:penicillin-binding protein 1C